mmetsp:Transcript_19759/g.18810  ORF Transcript_19759/g.18810 Transcript_19759/m.18810 type:complete len:80 (-) Transcript_19759:432-671(-)
MDHKKMIVIRQTPPQYMENISNGNEKHIKSWCCINQGHSKVSAVFEKNIFEPNEVTKAQAHVDNKGCNIALTGVNFKLE